MTKRVIVLEKLVHSFSTTWRCC